MDTLNSVLAPVRAQHHLSREEDGDGREQKSAQMPQRGAHASVMLHEAVALLAVGKNDVILDATAGMGGHSEAFLRAGAAKVVALDADSRAVEATRVRLAPFGARAAVVESNFKDAEAALQSLQVANITKALFDLGWNSTQLLSGKGFSFMHDEPLDMSYGKLPASGFTAAQIVNTWSEKVLADVFFGYGEERYARRIAKAIVKARELSPIQTTAQLVAIISDAVPALYRKGRLHPATRSFQALRIAVNDELGCLAKGIAGAWDMLAPGGRIAVITFHSIEDRAVKRAFVEYVKNGEGKLLHKKPLISSQQEVHANPRARSAKLRGIEKI